MIKPGEIDRIAIKEGVRATQIQKDYIISWILWGLSRNKFLFDNLVFKGGTCLKKIYFKDYRFSEDIDFTLLDDAVDNDEVLMNFNGLFDNIYETARIQLQTEKGSFEIHRSSGSIKFRIGFNGPHGNDYVKVDITRGEKILFDCGPKTVQNIYSDLDEENEINIKAYSLQEILIEKMAALMGRTIPRDLFDFYFLTESEGIEMEEVYIEFITKAENKGHDPKTLLQKVTPKATIFKRDWEISLANQIKKENFPAFKEVWRKANGQFRKLIALLGE